MTPTENAIVYAIRAHTRGIGIPDSEFDPEFVVRMINAMSMSFFKYGYVAEGVQRFDTLANLRTRVSEYRRTQDKGQLVDAANFAMMEAMHPSADYPDAHYATHNDSPGLVDRSTRRLVHENNKGDRLPKHDQ